MAKGPGYWLMALSHCLPDMLVEDEGTDGNEDDATEEFGTLAGYGANATANHHANRDHREGGNPDGGCHNANIGVDECEAYTDSHRVTAGRKASNRKQPK